MVAPGESNEEGTHVKMIEVWINCPDQETADRISDALISSGRIACSNTFPAIQSRYRWKKWAFGFNIVVPDYDFFSGNIADSSSSQSFLSYTDESLWSGIVGSYKASASESFGLSVYYTARSLIRSSLDRTVISPTHEIITTEEWV